MNLGLVRCTKQVVIVAHYFLISADEHERQIIRFVWIELMKLQHMLDVVQIDEFIYYSI